MTKHVFFDLDHTLWDFERNSEVCLQEIYQSRLTPFVDYKSFIDTFRVINRGLWRALEMNQITHDELRRVRFGNALKKLGVTCSDEDSLSMNEDFMHLLPQQKHLMNGAIEVLDYLGEKYTLHLISNGYLPIQTKKMQQSGILHYFDQIITSDVADSRKPDKKIFDFALQAAGSTNQNSIYIGDDEIADKEGAFNAEMPFIYYDITATRTSASTINHLLALKELL